MKFGFYIRKIYVKYTNEILLGENVRFFKKSIVDTNSFGVKGRIEIGDSTDVLYGVTLMAYGGFIKIGDRCSVNPFTVIYGMGHGTIIGDDVLIAGHCLIVPSNHIFIDNQVTINKQGETSKGILINNNVWIGSGCRILDGVTIGEGSVIAAGSVVNRDVPPWTLYGGVPAKKLKSLK